MVGCTLQRLLAIIHISSRDAAQCEEGGLGVPAHQTSLSSLSHLLSFPHSFISQKELKGKELRLGNGHPKLSFFTTSCSAMTYQIPPRRYHLTLFSFPSLSKSLSFLYGMMWIHFNNPDLSILVELRNSCTIRITIGRRD